MGDPEAVGDYPDTDQRYAVCNSLWDDKGTKRMELKHLDFGFEVKQISDEGDFEGYASTAGNVDRGGDIVEPGAFRASLDRYASKGKMPKMLWQHDPGKVVGVWEAMMEDDKGLYVKGRVLKELQLGKELYTLMKAGAIDSMSIGYRTIDAEFEGPGGQVRRLKELELFEVSLVTFPMNEEAMITHVKHLQSKGEVERILREAGVPNNFAKLVALYGFDEAKARTESGRREADAPAIEQAGLARLMATLNARKELTNG